MAICKSNQLDAYWMSMYNKFKRKWRYYMSPKFIYMVGQHVTVRPMNASGRHNKKLSTWFSKNNIGASKIDFPKVNYILYTSEQIKDFKKEFKQYFVD